MAGRGRGRGWGGRGGGFTTFASQVPFDLFPEDVTLPDAKIDDIDANTKKLLNWSYKFQNYWKASPYLLEERTSKKRQKMHIARFSDKEKTDFTRDSLSQVLMFNGFPQELVQGASKRMSRRKKFRWNPESGLMISYDLSPFILILQQPPLLLSPSQLLLQPSLGALPVPPPLPLYTNTIIVVTTNAYPINIVSTTVAITFIIITSTIIGKEDTEEKKDGEDEDEDENVEEEEEEDISDEDYKMNEYFDDDEDDYNDADDGGGIMKLSIRYLNGESSSAHPLTAIHAWTIASLMLQVGNSS
ncbi:hypothetical protein CR513_23866, partial [Mucuna pruriens]